MSFCLDDGTELLFGPATAGDEPASAILSEPGAPPVAVTGFPADEPQTAILRSTAAPGEAPTRAQINPTDQTAILRTGAEAEPRDSLGELSEKQSFSANRAAKPLAALVVAALLLAGGFFGYRYFSPANQIESIAVMPFVNESGNADVEYLSDGMTETLISSLSELQDLNVRARSSVFRYKGKNTDAQAIGKELNVQAILTGKVVQRAADLSLYVELVDVASDKVIWSETYNRQMTNLVALQRDITRDISTKLQTKLSGADEQKVAKTSTENAEAYQLYLRGRFHWNKRAEKDLLMAIDYFNQATAIDPSYALALTGLADAYSVLPGYSNVSAREAGPKAREFVLKALTLDNDLAEAHAALGAVLGNYDYDFAGAEREFKLAIGLNPNYATAHQWYSEILSYSGRHDEAIHEIRRAVELEPYSLIINRLYGENLFRARKYDESVEQLKKTIELDVNFAPAYRSLFSTYQVKGDHARAVEALARYFDLLGFNQSASLARETFAKGGWQGFERAMIGERARVNLPVHIVASFLVDLGDKDKALAELERAYDNGEYYVLLLKSDPRFDPLRDDPRFQKLVRKIGFSE